MHERATTAAYIAYSRAGERALEAESLGVLGNAFAARKQWRNALDTLRLSLDLRETAALLDRPAPDVPALALMASREKIVVNAAI